MTDLSILIPARNEMFLKNTVEDILAHIESDTEIIVVLDGEWPDDPIDDNDRVTIIYHSESIGQRAACNEAARMARGKYIMKVDAHCAFDQGFDRKLLEVIHPDWTMAPTMKNLHAFDWVCEDGHRRYQGPSGVCKECGKPTTMDIVWIAKKSPNSTAYCFDTEPHFQYMNEFKKRPEGQGILTESMSLQGSCFMMSKERYFDLNVCDEAFGSWGSQGIEVACKSWLSGGKVMIYQGTWYAHMFRTQGGDFGFPYHLSGGQVEKAKKMVRDLFFNNKWEKQIYPLSWLVERFAPVAGWKQEDIDSVRGDIKIPVVEPVEPKIEIIEPKYEDKKDTTLRKGIVYYTDNRIDESIMLACQKQIKQSVNGYPIVSVSLKPIDFGLNAVLPLERGYLAMFTQILTGLYAIKADIVFLCEHDVLYHPSHFDFVPPRDDMYYYNLNVWKVNSQTGHAVHYDCKQTSGLCARRDLLIQHYQKRVKRVEESGYDRNMGFEPGSHHRNERIDDYGSESWFSQFPNVDIRHDKNLTPSRWSKDKFRDQRNCRNWIEAEIIPGWGNYTEFMEKLKV